MYDILGVKEVNQVRKKKKELNSHRLRYTKPNKVIVLIHIHLKTVV